MNRKRVEYLMKTDDDMYINLAKLNAVVRQNRKPTLLMGSLICNAVPIKVLLIGKASLQVLKC